ncbi:hypothetical protein HDU87_006513 [Geranomyces variabilis]|uniref:Uncharacterized protein n=1 Tax=Geranomyces variabilis TaxID=109894 RepID=A0AAD5XQF4_9FUNG|nr:hypothetical protein HDU87_006513 [Geranomyces variabilis]
MCPGGSPFFLAILENLKEMDLQGNRLVNCPYGVVHALKRNLLPLAKWMLAQGAADLKDSTRRLDVLKFAIKSGNLDIVQWVVQEKLQEKLHKSEDLNLSLELALRLHHLDIAKYILDVARAEPETGTILADRAVTKFSMDNDNPQYLESWFEQRLGDPQGAAEQAGLWFNLKVTQFLHKKGVDLEPALRTTCREMDDERVLVTTKVVPYVDFLLSLEGGCLAKSANTCRFSAYHWAQ